MSAASSSLKIGDLSKLSGVKAVTIRYYEKMGLLPSPLRTAGNYRSYGPAHLARLRFIRRCRDLGFSIKESRTLLELASNREQQCAEVDRITDEHLRDIERKIADLTRLAEELRRIASSCRAGRRIADCRILEALTSN